jgi:RNA polymerase sigma-70 factor (ECF subfamily)
LIERILHAIQNELSADQRHVIVLRFWEEFSLQDTANILGKRVDHIKVIQARAIAKLRKILQYEEIKQAPHLPLKMPISTSTGAFP